MRYQLAFRYVLDRPGGFTNLLLVTVCNLIPVVGPIATLGYRAEVAVALDRDPDLRRHPKFTFDRFVEYLTRGLWPFLIALLFAVLLVPLVLCAFVAGMLVDPPAGNGPPVLALALGAVAYLIGFGLYVVVIIPMTLHAELTGVFDFGGGVRFALAFWKLVPGPAIASGIVFMILSSVVAICGLLCCVIGVYPASALTQMAGMHLMVQLYRKYVERGGEPLIEADAWDDEPGEWDERDGRDEEDDRRDRRNRRDRRDERDEWDEWDEEDDRRNRRGK